MKVLLINGSPRRKGCTYTALEEITTELHANGVETEIIEIGPDAIRGCVACGYCRKSGTSRCIFKEDLVNQILDKAETADGFIFGSPVYYASANGSMISLLDRLFFAGSNYLKGKPAAVVASARRAGTTATYDQLNKYIQINNMIMVPAPYWNMVHGNTPEEVKKDEEGLFIMRSLGKNMAWLLQLIELGKQTNLPAPELGDMVRTNFIQDK